MLASTAFTFGQIQHSRRCLIDSQSIFTRNRASALTGLMSHFMHVDASEALIISRCQLFRATLLS